MTTILNGDCLDVLKTLPDESIHMVCTSPPYWNLRSYLPADHPDKHKEIGTEKTPDCGLRGKVRLRTDLTADQKARVARWLLGAVGCDDERGDNDGKA